MVGCILMIILFIILGLISPVLSYFFGYIAGQFIEWTVGDQVINGLNLLFNTTRFSPHMLPMICGALGVVGSFFKSSANIKTKG
jgi:hypothetical protein